MKYEDWRSMFIMAMQHIIVHASTDYGPYIAAILAVVPGLVVAITAWVHSQNTAKQVGTNGNRLTRMETVINGHDLTALPPAPVVPVQPVIEP